MGKHWVPDELDRTVVSTYAKDLYRALCRRAGKTSRWPGSKKQLAAAITASDRTVHNALVELRDLSMASWRRSDLESGVSIYTVLPPERWEPEAFARHDVPTGMHRGRAKVAGRHHVPTLGSTSCTSTPGSKEGSTSSAAGAAALSPLGAELLTASQPSADSQQKLSVWEIELELLNNDKTGKLSQAQARRMAEALGGGDGS